MTKERAKLSRTAASRIQSGHTQDCLPGSRIVTTGKPSGVWIVAFAQVVKIQRFRHTATLEPRACPDGSPSSQQSPDRAAHPETHQGHPGSCSARPTHRRRRNPVRAGHAQRSGARSPGRAWRREQGNVHGRMTEPYKSDLGRGTATVNPRDGRVSFRGARSGRIVLGRSPRQFRFPSCPPSPADRWPIRVRPEDDAGFRHTSYCDLRALAGIHHSPKRQPRDLTHPSRGRPATQPSSRLSALLPSAAS